MLEAAHCQTIQGRRAERAAAEARATLSASPSTNTAIYQPAILPFRAALLVGLPMALRILLPKEIYLYLVLVTPHYPPVYLFLCFCDHMNFTIYCMNEWI